MLVVNAFLPASGTERPLGVVPQQAISEEVLAVSFTEAVGPETARVHQDEQLGVRFALQRARHGRPARNETGPPRPAVKWEAG
ncbi:MAG: hypothetical protein ACRDT6_02380 [Micromonosporaceae bacterium]